MTAHTLPGLVAPPSVGAPPISPVAPHGLFSAALRVLEPPVKRMGMLVEEWTAGFQFTPEACDVGGVWVPCVTRKPLDDEPSGEGGSGDDSGLSTQVKSQFIAPTDQLFVPYWVEGQFTCSTYGFEVADYVGKATRHLNGITELRAENELWTGNQMADHPTGLFNQSLVHSTPAAGVLNPGGSAAPVAVSPRAALALLAQGVAERGGTRAVIHAIPYLAELWGTARFIHERCFTDEEFRAMLGIDEMAEAAKGSDLPNPDGALPAEDTVADFDGSWWPGSPGRPERHVLMSSTRGSLIVSGAGYPGTGPAVTPSPTPATDHCWVYATGVVNYRLGRAKLIPGADEMVETIAEAVSTRINQVTYRAERPAATVWDPCITVAVLVDMSLGVS